MAVPHVRLLLSVLGAFALTACRGSVPPGAPPPSQVKLIAVEPSTIEESSEFIASLNSRRAVDLRPRVSGIVAQILAKPGELVKAGQTVMQLDPAKDKAQFNNLLAVQGSRAAALKLAQDNFDRTEKLAPSGVVSQRDFDEAASNLARAKAEHAAAEAAVREQGVQVSYYRVVAPFEGVVGDLPVKIGDVVSPQTVLTSITQEGPMEANVAVPLQLAPKLGPDTRITLLDAVGKPLVEGKADFIAPSVDPSTQSVLVKMRFDNRPQLRYSQYVRARVTWGSRQGLRIPAVAVFRQSGQHFVYVVTPDPKDPKRLVANQRPIQVGEMVGNDYVVRDGLKAGELVIVSGVQFVRNGAPVQPDKS
jgi:RND family efflux transporter MFP subunit